MTTYLNTYPTLRQQIRLADAIVVAGRWQLGDPWPDELVGDRELVLGDVVAESVIKGECGPQPTILVTGGERGARPRYLEASRSVAFLQYDANAGRWVPLFGSVFPLDGDTLVLSDSVTDDRASTDRPLTLDELTALVDAETSAQRQELEAFAAHEPEAARREGAPAVSERPGEADLELTHPSREHESGPAFAEPRASRTDPEQ